MSKSNNLFKVPVQVFIFLYSIVGIALYAGVLYLMSLLFKQTNIFNDIQEIIIYIFCSFIYIVLVLILGSYLYVLISIPTKISTYFDEIKNDIAARRIKDEKAFSIKLVEFLNSYFDFAFFDLEFSFVKLNDHQLINSEEKIMHLLQSEDFDLIDYISRKSEKVELVRKVNVENRKWYLYVIPIYFENNYYGYIGTFSSKKLGKVYRQILADFEDNYVDDNLVNILNFK